MKKHGLIVFDMDGVLIDVSKSYRETVRRAVCCFFKAAIGGEGLPDPLFSLSELAKVKQGGGLNNDWDLTHRVIQLLCQLIKPINQAGGVSKNSKKAWVLYRSLVPKWDVRPLSQFLKNSDRPLTRLLAKAGVPDNEFVETMYQGDVGSGNIIKQLFQEIYLGPELFFATYGFSPVIHKDIGLNQSEKLIIDKTDIEELSRRYHLAIATGRPRSEAIYPLEMFNLRPFFEHVLTLDDCLAAEKERFPEGEAHPSFSKPHPFMLDAIMAEIGRLPERCYYVGDMPDDMIAATRAQGKYTGIGFTGTAPNANELVEKLIAAGAESVFKRGADLMAFFCKK